MNQSVRVISGAFLLNLIPFEVKSVFGCLLVNTPSGYVVEIQIDGAGEN